MKQYRYKNVSELKREFGEGWREEADVLPSEEDKRGKMLTNKQNALIEQTNGGKDGVDRLLLKLVGIDMRQIIEVPQISCDVEKVYFDGKKRRVTVKLRNGNEGRSTCSPEDVFDPYVGFAVAYARAVCGSASQLRKYVDARLERQMKHDPDLEKIVKGKVD